MAWLICEPLFKQVAGSGAIHHTPLQADGLDALSPACLSSTKPHGEAQTVRKLSLLLLLILIHCALCIGKMFAGFHLCEEAAPSLS